MIFFFPLPPQCSPFLHAHVMLFTHSLFLGLNFIFAHNTPATAASPMGAPGCPEFDFCTTSAQRARIELIALVGGGGISSYFVDGVE